MRKCIFYLTALFCGFAIFAEAEYKVSSISESLTLPFFTFKVESKTDSTEFSSVPNFSEPAWGFSLHPKGSGYVPANFLFGKISASGSYSKLKSPVISASSALSSGFSKVNMLKINLPSASNFKNPISVGGTFNYYQKDVLQKLSASFFATEESFFLSSIFCRLKTGKKSNLEFSLTSGKFKIENSSNSWFSKTLLFAEQEFYAINVQCGFFSPIFKTKENVNIYETLRNPAFTFSTENSFSLNNFFLNASFFCASQKNIFTANSSRLKTLSQIKINPQFTFFPFGDFLKVQTGAIFYAEQKIQTDESIALNKKLVGQINFITKNHKIKISSAANGKNVDDSFSAKVNISSNVFLNPTETFSFTKNNKTEKMTFKFSEKIYFSDKTKRTTQSVVTSAAITTKNGDDLDFALETKANLKTKTKYLTVSCSAGISYEGEN